MRSLMLGGVAVVNLASGFLLQQQLYAHLGVGRQTDALIASMALPQVLFVCLTTPLSAVLTPFLAGIQKQGSSPRGSDLDSRNRSLGGPLAHQRVATAVSWATVLVSLPIIAVLFLTVERWISILLPGFDAEGQQLVCSLLRIQLVGLLAAVPYGPAFASTAALGRFLEAEFALASVSIVALVLVGPVTSAFGIEGAAWIYAFRTGARALVLLPLSSIGLNFVLCMDELKLVTQRALPLFVSGVFYKTEPLADQYLASMAPPGALSLFNLAQALQVAGYGIVHRAFFLPVAPRFGVLAHAEDWRDFNKELRLRLVQSVLVSGGALGIAFVLGQPVLELIFVTYGSMTKASVYELWLLGMILGGQFFLMTMNHVLASALTATGRTLQTSVAMSTSFVMGLGLKVGGFYLFGIVGLALGTSAYYLATCSLLSAAWFKVSRGSLHNRSDPVG